MRIITRNGNIENLNLNKISERINKACVFSNLNIDTDNVAIKVVESIRDLITTSELDEITAKICINMSLDSPQYGFLGSRVIVNNHQKNVNLSFVDAMEGLYDNDGESNLVSDELIEVVRNNGEYLNKLTQDNQKNDFLIDYFGFKTLERSYFLKTSKGKILETPQYLWMRVAIGIWGDNIDKVEQTYLCMSNKNATHATPTLFNAGTKNPALSSCFLLGTEDSIDGIYENITDCAKISKWAGGIGVHISNIRPKGSYIKGTGGRTDGIVPMMKVYNSTARYVNQCFTPDTVIYTSNGPKEIRDVVAGVDMVITSSGEYKMVNMVFTNAIDKEICNIVPLCGSWNKLKCTDVHQIMIVKCHGQDYEQVREKLDSGEFEREWVNAGDVKQGDLMCFPVPTYKGNLKQLDIDYLINLLDQFKKYGSHMEYLKDLEIGPLEETICSIIDEHSENYKNSGVYVLNSESKKAYDALRYALIRLGQLPSGDFENGRYTTILPRNKYMKNKTGTVVDDFCGFFNKDGWMYTPVVENNMEPYKGTVYDLNVEDNHNYLTENGLVHNSGKRLGSIACFVKDTEVYTNNGVKFIQDVEIGDLVVTHKNRLKPVVQVHKNKLEERKIYKLEVQRNKPIYVTGNHKFWSFRTKKYKNNKISFGWNSVEELKSVMDNPETTRQACYISTPSSTNIEDTKEYKINVCDFDINLNEIENNKVQLLTSKGLSGQKVNKFWNITEDFANLIGIWLGDGCIKKRKDKINGICFTVHNINKDEIEFIERVCEETFGCNVTSWNNNNTINICVNSRIVGIIFNELFKSGFNNKELCSQMFNWPKRLVNSLIAGLITTDGHITKYKHNATLGLSNEKLMTQIYHLCRANGIVSSFLKYKKQDGMTTEPYSMSIPLSKDIVNQLHKYYPDGRLEKCREKTYYEDNFLKILSVTETDRNDEFVYTLGIEEDHSYMVEGLLAENCYLEPWHSDVFDFLGAMRNHGHEETLARDLFYALWIPDLFMKAVKNNGDWYLMDNSVCDKLTDLYGDEFDEYYNEQVELGKYTKKIKALDLWNEILKSQQESGMPYMCYKDSVNKKSNHQNIGTIKSSNLCVAPETRILTSTGYHKISELEGETVDVWNGEEWSTVTPQKTGTNQKLIKGKSFRWYRT